MTGLSVRTPHEQWQNGPDGARRWHNDLLPQNRIRGLAPSRLYKRGNLARSSIADNAWARRATCSVFAHERVYYLTRKNRCAIFHLVLDSQNFGNTASVFDRLARGIVVNEHARNADYLQPRIHKQARRNRRIDAAATFPEDDTRTWV